MIIYNTNYFLNLNESLFKFEYLAILIFLIVAIILSLIIVGFSYLLSIQNPESEKLSTYECGFEPYEDSRHNFDIETMFLLPWSVTLSQLNLLGFWSMIDFIIELGVGFVYVWYIGALEWD